MLRKKRKKIERAAATTRSTRGRNLRGDKKKVWPKQKPLQGQTSKRSEYEALLAAPPAAEGGRHRESMSLGSKMIFFNHPAAKDEDTLAEFFMQRYEGGLKEGHCRRNARDLFRYSENNQKSSGQSRRRNLSRCHGVTCHKPLRKPTIRKPKPAPAVLGGMITGITELDYYQASPRYFSQFQSQSMFIKALFNPYEFVALKSDGYGRRARVLTCTEWLNTRSQETEPSKYPLITPEEDSDGGWCYMNPLKSREFKGGNPQKGDIADFRYMLLEMDHTPLNEQLDIIGNKISNVAAVVLSAGRGYHVIQRVDARSRAEYDRMVEDAKRKYVSLGFDEDGIGQPTARLPYCYRKGKMQRMIYLCEHPLDQPIFKDPDGKGRRWYNANHNRWKYSLEKKGGN